MEQDDPKGLARAKSWQEEWEGQIPGGSVYGSLHTDGSTKSPNSESQGYHSHLTDDELRLGGVTGLRFNS